MATDTEKHGSFVAGGTISKGMVCILDTTNNYPYCVVATDDTSVILGVAAHDAVSGESVELHTTCGDVVLMRASGDISEGDNVCPDGSNDGEVKTAASGDQVCGKAMEAGSADTLFRVQLKSGWLLA